MYNRGLDEAWEKYARCAVENYTYLVCCDESNAVPEWGDCCAGKRGWAFGAGTDAGKVERVGRRREGMSPSVNKLTI